MIFRYTKHHDIISRSAIIDGYSAVDNLDGPMRNRSNEVVYYDPSKGTYIKAVDVYKFVKL